MAAGTATDVAITHGTYWATYGTQVLTQARDVDRNRVLWLYGGDVPADGSPVAVACRLPHGSRRVLR
ncbi:hypothetical protein ACIRPU_42900 [Streptomyces sp. NPDC102259]|uniref:hypothetical protein n=1 Tax=Streptomyces sp. NPDC102259 TaxID=3366148 RepID=UPI0037F88535